MTALSIVFIVIGFLWFAGTCIIAFATAEENNGKPSGMTDDRLYAWIFFWPILVMVKLIHTIRLAWAEVRRACRTEI